MIRINLLPPEIHRSEVQKQLSIAGGVLGGLIVLSLLAFWGARVAKAHQLESDLNQANDELKKYQVIVDKVDQLEQTRNQLRSRRDVIQQLLRGRLTYPKFFEDFLSWLPSEIWLTNLTTSPHKEGGLNVSVSAQSLSNFSIADWMTHLHASPSCQEVSLGAISATEEAEGQAPTLTFSMRFWYQRKDE